jgi:hypothetical protein
VDRLLKRGLKRPGYSAGQHPDDSSSSADEGTGVAGVATGAKQTARGGQPSPRPSTPPADGSQDQQQQLVLKEGHSSASEGEEREGVRK